MALVGTVPVAFSDASSSDISMLALDSLGIAIEARLGLCWSQAGGVRLPVVLGVSPFKCLVRLFVFPDKVAFEMDSVLGFSCHIASLDRVCSSLFRK